MSGSPLTTPSTGSLPAAAAAPAGRQRSWPVPAVIILATLVVLGLRLYELTRPGYLHGVIEYDDGPDFGSAIRLIHGALPYRDFIMVQPPGITLLMAPVALATKAAGTAAGMSAARVVTALASAAAVPAGGLLTRHRGLFAVLVTCGILAVCPDGAVAARTVLLEPWLVLFCLLGALAVFDKDRIAGPGRLLIGGLAFGFAGAVKVWAILPVLVIVALTARRPRHLGAYLAGVAVGFLAPVLPFALTAPRTFYRSVIVAQLVRTDLARIPMAFRLQHMLGLSHAPDLATPLLVAAGLVVLAAIAWAMVAAARIGGIPPPALDWFAAGTLALTVVAFLWPADFYDHYAAFLAPFLALAIALAGSRLLAVAGPGGSRWAAGSRRAAGARRAAVPVAAAALASFTVMQAVAESHLASALPASEFTQAQRLIPRGSCVVTDQVAYTIMVDRFVSRLPGCPLMIDGIGSDYALSNGRNGLTGAGDTPAVAALWMSAFRSAQYLWLTGGSDKRIPWTPALQAYVNAHFVPLTEGPDWLYVRSKAGPSLSAKSEGAHHQPGPGLRRERGGFAGYPLTMRGHLADVGG